MQTRGAITDPAETVRRWVNPGESRVYVLTFGCQQNEADSERLLGLALSLGYGRADAPEDAELILVNTCAIREHAELKALSIIGGFKHVKEKNPRVIIGVCGCMAAEPHRVEDLKRRYPYVSFTLEPAKIASLPAILAGVIQTKKRAFLLPDGPTEVPPIDEGIPVERLSRHKAWVSVMYGCNNFCTYCIVPYVRGRERSRESGEVLAEVKGLVESGVKEITLLGQNVNSYRSDCDFADLVGRIGEIPGDFRLRFMTSHPKDVSDALIARFGATPHLASQFHLPLQSGSDAILKKMNRHYGVDRYLSIVERLRERDPAITLTSDVIVGFPGETDADFEATLALLEKVRFDSVYSFIYSPRRGTPAADYPDPVPPDVSRERMRRLLDLQCAISAEKNRPLEGRALRVLCDGPSPDGAPGIVCGRTEGNKLVHFPGDEKLTGQFVFVKIDRADAFALRGTLVE
ncbi:MAG: tRNA (N6-isopentenyl adenosine(37)-C2)-methylthiotransferase MiaB [Clostridia bacterium]|nr:tRNA (N6-isopentenyl adenosine(37)-C2)-methylthiotransferase MiaB [Clostridia bacterium]